MASKQSKKTRARRGRAEVSPRHGAKARREKGRLPESQQTEAEPEVLDENERRAENERKAQEREVTIGQAEREAELASRGEEEA